MAKKQKYYIKCFVYLSVEGDKYNVGKKERKQRDYIMQYAEAHKIKVAAIYHKDIFGRDTVRKHFNLMALKIKNGEADGLLLANMGAVSYDMADAYYKIGLIAQAGGRVITVDEGELSLNIKRIGGISNGKDF